MKEKLRKSGIDIIGDFPWGTHLCQFYQTKEDLIDILVPYFKAGLENNEFCMWITAEPLNVEDAKEALREAVKDLDDYIAKGQIEIMDYSQWYIKSGKFNSDEVLQGWVDKEKNALANGYDGLRLTGNTFWLEKEDWDDFTDYEEVINKIIGNYNMIAVCTYSLDKCNALEIIDVVKNHQFALIKQRGKWKSIESSESKSLRKSVKNGEARYQSLFSNMIDGFAYHKIVLDEAGKPIDYIFLEVNNAFERLTGLKREAIIGKKVTEVIPGIENDHADWIGRYGEVALTGNETKFENYAEALDRWYSISAYSPEKGYFVAVFEDITARKKAEEQRSFQAALWDNMNDAVIATDDAYNITEWNKAATDQYGWAKEEVIGKNSTEILRTAMTENQRKDLIATLSSKGSAMCETTQRHKNGRIIDVEAKLVKFTDNAGQVIGYIATNRDITERKQIEDALKESEEKYRTIVEAAQEGIAIGPPGGGITFVNQRMADMLGYPKEEIIGKTGLDFMDEEEKIKVSQVRENLKEGKSLQLEYKFRRKDGSILWTLGNSSPLYDNSGRHIGNLGMHSDITERKKAEDALRISEERLSIVLKNSSIVVSQLDKDLRYTWIYNFHPDYQPERILGKQTDEIETDPNRAELKKIQRRVLESGIGTKVELPINIAGEPEIYNVSIEPLRDSSGNIVGLTSVSMNVTELKKAEQEIKKLAKFPEENPSPIFRVSKDGVILYVNKAGLSLTSSLGYKEGDTLSGLWGEFVIDTLNSGKKKVVDSDEIDGRVYSATIAPIIDAGYVNVYMTDVTERKQMEDALRQSQADLNRAQSVGNIGSWRLNVQTNELVWSDETHQIFGIPKGNPMTYEAFLSVIHPDDRKYVSEKWQAATRGELYDIEHRIIVNGMEKWVREMAELEFDSNDELLGGFGVVQDVTERKHFEKQLLWLEQRNLILAESASALLVADDPQIIIDRICQWTMEFLDCQVFFNFLAVPEKNKLQLNAYHGIPKEEAKRIEWLNYGTAVCGCVAQNGKRIIAEDIPNTKDSRTDLVRSYGVRAYCCHPLLVGEKVLGTISFGTTERDKFEEKEVSMMMATADMVAIAMQRKQAETELERNRDHLAELVRERTAELEEERALLAQRVYERTAELSLANMELEKASRLKDEFMASMSHELRTPINGILGMAEVMSNKIYGDLNEEQLEALQAIDQSGRHLLELINDILDISKITVGQLELESRLVSVKQVCESSMRFVEREAQRKRLKISTSFDSSAMTAIADERRLKQILVNLLGNAVKFTNEGGSVGLEITGDADNELIKFTVWDTGIGISKEQQSLLFQPFVQLDSRLSRRYEGTGLGLALALKLAELHNGSISVESELGKGSRFTLSLPWKQDCGITEIADETEYDISNTAEIGKVLLIEDSEPAAAQIVRYLTEYGIESVIYPQGESAVNKAMEVKPDVIILDIMLPGISGWDVLEQLRANPNTKDIPVVIISVVDDKPRATMLGANKYLIKPITKEQLLNALCKIPSLQSDRSKALIVMADGEFRKPLILLADDNEICIKSVSAYLVANGCYVMIARNGKEALQRVEESVPDLILMDIQMPDIDGLQAIRIIRSNRRFADIPIVALTALAMPGDRERCLESGANEYIAKPVKLDTLVKIIREKLRTR